MHVDEKGLQGVAKGRWLNITHNFLIEYPRMHLQTHPLIHILILPSYLFPPLRLLLTCSYFLSLLRLLRHHHRPPREAERVASDLSVPALDVE